MDPPPTLELERFAALSAELEAGSSSDEVLAREGLSAEAWTQLQERWLGQIAEEVSRGRFELNQRYNEAFNARRGELAAASSGEDVPPRAEAPPESLTGEIVVTPKAEARATLPDIGQNAEVRATLPDIGQNAEVRATLPDITQPAEARTTLPEITQRADVRMTLPDITPPAEGAPNAGDRVTPTDIMQVEAPPASDSPLTPRVPTMLGSPGRLVSATPFVSVQEARREDLDDAPTPAPSTEDPVAPRSLISTLPPGATLSDDDDPVTPAPPRSMGRDARDDGPRFDGLPFRPPPSVAPDTPPRASSSAMPDILPFRATGPASGFSPLLPAPQAPPAPQALPAPQAPPAHPQAPASPHALAPSIPVAAPTLPGASGPPPGAFPFASSAQPRQEPAARPPAGAFPFAPGAAPRPALPASAAPAPQLAAPQAQLMMPASLGASTCRLTIEQFASLSAEIAITPGASAQVRARYGLDEMSHMAESGVRHRRFSVDKELFTRYSALYQSYREWLTKTLR